MVQSILKNKVTKMIILFFVISMVGTLSSAVDKVKIEYFGRKDCKNCANLEKFLTELSNKRKDFEYIEYKIDENGENKKFFDEVTTKLKLVKGTPIIYLNGHIIQGFNTPDTTGKEIVKLIDEGKKANSVITLE